MAPPSMRGCSRAPGVFRTWLSGCRRGESVAWRSRQYGLAPPPIPFVFSWRSIHPPATDNPVFAAIEDDVLFCARTPRRTRQRHLPHMPPRRGRDGCLQLQRSHGIEHRGNVHLNSKVLPYDPNTPDARGHAKNCWNASRLGKRPKITIKKRVLDAAVHVRLSVQDTSGR